MSSNSAMLAMLLGAAAASSPQERDCQCSKSDAATTAEERKKKIAIALSLHGIGVNEKEAKKILARRRIESLMEGDSIVHMIVKHLESGCKPPGIGSKRKEEALTREIFAEHGFEFEEEAEDDSSDDEFVCLRIKNVKEWIAANVKSQSSE